MHRYLSLLLFIGLALGQGLWLANTTGDTVVIIQGERFILMKQRTPFLQEQHILKKVDYQNQTIIVKKGLMGYEKIKFDAIRSIRYLKSPFSILPSLIGGGLGWLLYNKTVTYDNPHSYALKTVGKLSSYIIAGSGVVTSLFIPTYSKKHILDDDGWSIISE